MGEQSEPGIFFAQTTHPEVVHSSIPNNAQCLSNGKLY